MMPFPCLYALGGVWLGLWPLWMLGFKTKLIQLRQPPKRLNSN